MKAMIFAAGLGTRLRPLTDTTPKALVKVAGKPLLQNVIEKLVDSGYTDFIINVHHHARQVEHFLENFFIPGVSFTLSDETYELLDTGGGLKKAAWFFHDSDNFLVHNVDIISDIPLDKMLRQHQSSNALVTIAVRNRKTNRYFLFDNKGQLCGWENLSTGQRQIVRPSEKYIPLAYSGIFIAKNNFLSLLQKKTGAFSLTPELLELAEKHFINAFLHDNGYWFDVGKPEALVEINQVLKQKTNDK